MLFDALKRIRDFTNAVFGNTEDQATELNERLGVVNPPKVRKGGQFRYRALIDTPAGVKELNRLAKARISFGCYMTSPSARGSLVLKA